MRSWVWLALVFVCACDKSSDQDKYKIDRDPVKAKAALAKHAPKSEARLAKIAALATKEVALDKQYLGPSGLSPAKVVLEGKPGKEKLVPKGNALVVYRSDLGAFATPTAAPRVPYRFREAGQALQCAAALHLGKMSSFPTYSDHVAQELEAREDLAVFQGEFICGAVETATHVIVIDQQVKAAHVNFEKGSGEKTFTPGTVDGTLAVFDIETGEYFGARAFSAQSSEQVDYTVQVDRQTGKQVGGAMADMSAVASDMFEKTNVAIAEGIAAL